MPLSSLSLPPPTTLPAHDLRLFWCLIDGEERPYLAYADLKWNVFQLTEAVQKPRAVLRDLDTSDLVLLQVRLYVLLTSVNVLLTCLPQLKVPIPVDPESTLPQRLPM
jgi:hypothetical protein